MHELQIEDALSAGLWSREQLISISRANKWQSVFVRRKSYHFMGIPVKQRQAFAMANGSIPRGDRARDEDYMVQFVSVNIGE